MINTIVTGRETGRIFVHIDNSLFEFDTETQDFVLCTIAESLKREASMCGHDAVSFAAYKLKLNNNKVIR